MATSISSGHFHILLPILLQPPPGAPVSAIQPTTTPVASTPVTLPVTSTGGFRAANTSTPVMLNDQPANREHSISANLSVTDPGPVQWQSAIQGRPTLTGGIPSGRIAGTPAQIARSADDPALLADDNKSRRKTTPGDQSMRRSIQDLVASVDPNVKIEPEVEDLLLSIADEFIDSVTNFGCRLAKHRGSDTLEVRDLQLHLERNHNIRIPGFASDEARISLAQNLIGQAPAAGVKKSGGGPQTTLRSHRIAQVQQAKREAKLS
ncbi:hypothetical protein HGRIS_002858 [Hohenbuehelia grisea]|uniref:Transcription initiation factor TFIID subunit 12 domain-containing protein n=1 Tax=Hohenbuehelia grisea TaxID=104357 RepID=A0ABR3JN58_9AGAR